jgi:Ca2+-binding RTX toxin-like protein
MTIKNFKIMSLLLLVIIGFSFQIGFVLENNVYGIKYWCDENILVCNGDEGDDQITGNDNNNIIYGWTGNDYLRGMAGDDVILGAEGSDTIIGDTSSDVFNVNDHGKDVLIGGAGDDILMGYNGSDDIYGGTGDDWLRDFGPRNSDELNNFHGEEGNDLLVGSSSTDNFNCGEGVDVVLNFNSTQGDKSQSTCEIVIKEKFNESQNNQEYLAFAPLDNGTMNLGKE